MHWQALGRGRPPTSLAQPAWGWPMAGVSQRAVPGHVPCMATAPARAALLSRARVQKSRADRENSETSNFGLALFSNCNPKKKTQEESQKKVGSLVGFVEEHLWSSVVSVLGDPLRAEGSTLSTRCLLYCTAAYTFASCLFLTLTGTLSTQEDGQPPRVLQHTESRPQQRVVAVRRGDCAFVRPHRGASAACRG